ncbi:MAG: urea transporter, partial [Thioalkalispiraceae bacterium]
ANADGAFLAMALGTATGLMAYFLIGFYVAALVSAVVSMLVTFISIAVAQQEFNWKQLNQEQIK